MACVSIILRALNLYLIFVVLPAGSPLMAVRSYKRIIYNWLQGPDVGEDVQPFLEQYQTFQAYIGFVN